MAKRKKVWMVQVDPRLIDEPKFKRFARMVKEDVLALDNLYEHAAYGLLVRLWGAVMTYDDTGKLDPAPEDVAEKVDWHGPPPERLIAALLDCGKNSVEPNKPGFIVKTENGYEVYKWAEWQNDPAGKRERWAEAKRRAKTPQPTPPPPSKEIDARGESVRQILQAMKQANTPGGKAMKEEYVAAWCARPGIGAKKVLELLWSPEAKGQNIFWLDSQLGGKPLQGGAKGGAGVVGAMKDWVDKGMPAQGGGK